MNLLHKRLNIFIFLYKLLTGLKLPLPQLILSVTGGAKYFEPDKAIENELKFLIKSLINATKRTDTWIISGGSDVGVMKLIGNVVNECTNGQDLTVLGIASRKRIFGTYQDLFKKNNETVDEKNNRRLNPNHSAFIIVDNENKNGHEIEFRNKLENYIKTSLSIPIILIAIDGGLGTLKTIQGGLENKIPILLVSVNCLAKF